MLTTRNKTALRPRVGPLLLILLMLQVSGCEPEYPWDDFETHPDTAGIATAKDPAGTPSNPNATTADSVFFEMANCGGDDILIVVTDMGLDHGGRAFSTMDTLLDHDTPMVKSADPGQVGRVKEILEDHPEVDGRPSAEYRARRMVKLCLGAEVGPVNHLKIVDASGGLAAFFGDGALPLGSPSLVMLPPGYYTVMLEAYDDALIASFTLEIVE